jgi:hypothetical protein
MITNLRVKSVKNAKKNILRRFTEEIDCLNFKKGEHDALLSWFYGDNYK